MTAIPSIAEGGSGFATGIGKQIIASALEKTHRQLY